MMRFRAKLTGTSLVFAASLCGCAMRGNVELLEARLRQQEDQIVRVESQLQKAESELAAAERQTQHLRVQLAGRGEKTLLPEQASSLFRATGIQFNKLLTGGLNYDRVEGDELLSAVVVPHDADGELVKIPGQIELQAYDLSRDGEEKLIGKWRYGVEECRGLWHSGFLGSGYLVRVPWIETPRSPRIMLHAKLVTADGRQFETSEPIDITPPERSSGVEQTSGNAAKKALPDDSDHQMWDFDEAKRDAPVVPAKLNRDQTTEGKSEKAMTAKAKTDQVKRPPEDGEGRVRTSDNWTDETLPVLR